MTYTRALAAAYPTWALLQHAVIYLTDLEAGTVRGIGALIYRLAHGIKPRALQDRERWHPLFREAELELLAIEEATHEASSGEGGAVSERAVPVPAAAVG